MEQQPRACRCKRIAAPAVCLDLGGCVASGLPRMPLRLPVTCGHKQEEYEVQGKALLKACLMLTAAKLLLHAMIFCICGASHKGSIPCAMPDDGLEFFHSPYVMPPPACSCARWPKSRSPVASMVHISLGLCLQQKMCAGDYM